MMELKNHEALLRRLDDLKEYREKLLQVVDDNELNIYGNNIVELVNSINNTFDDDLPDEIINYFKKLLANVNQQINNLNFIREQADQLVLTMSLAK